MIQFVLNKQQAIKQRMLGSRQSLEEKTLKYDINTLLSLFNEIDLDNSGFINKNELNRYLGKLGIEVNTYCKLQVYADNDRFEFDGVLSLMGSMQVPNEPAVYVISFVKILAGYRNKCILMNEQDDNVEQGLTDAQEIDQRIKKIVKRELERQRDRLLQQHNRIYDQMNKTQDTQFHNFEEQWKKYLEEFKAQTHEKVYKTKVNKIKQLSFESQKLVKSARRNSLVTSPKLIELLQRKKRLVKEGKYADAIKINYMIESQKQKIEDHNEQSLEYAMRKRIKSLKKKNESAMDYIQSEMTTNVHKLLHKKQEGEHLMKIKMRNLREEAQRKLNEHLRSQLTRLRSTFGRAAKY